MNSQVREIRVCLIGDGAVGKSSVLSRLMGRVPTQRHDPTIEDSYFMQAVVDGEVINIRYLDTSGQDEYGPLVDVSIKASNVVIVVCDVERDNTLAIDCTLIVEAMREDSQLREELFAALTGDDEWRRELRKKRSEHKKEKRTTSS